MKNITLAIALMLSASAWAAKAKPAKCVDLNKATESELLQLKGVGAAKAKATVAGRPYKDAAEWATKVKGIGPKTVEENKGWTCQ